MANEENLRPCEYKLSQEEAKKGGIASGKARREKRTMVETLKAMLDETAQVKGNSQGLTYREIATLGLLKGASKGNANNYKVILEALGETNILDRETAEPIININVTDNSNLAKEFKDEEENWFMDRNRVYKSR